MVHITIGPHLLYNYSPITNDLGSKVIVYSTHQWRIMQVDGGVELVVDEAQ